MFESIFTTSATEVSVTIMSFFVSLVVAFILGMVISYIYTKTQKEKIASQSFAITLVLLPAVITIIIMLVGNNVARAFSLAGAFSIIRFRSAPGDPKDITYVLCTMAIGLACGMGFIVYALLASMVLSGVILFLEIVNFGKSNVNQKILKIMIPEDLNYHHVFDEVLKCYTQKFQLTRVKTANLGSIYELVYLISTSEALDEKAFIDELRCRNGNLNITLVLAPQSSEL